MELAYFHHSVKHLLDAPSVSVSGLGWENTHTKKTNQDTCGLADQGNRQIETQETTQLLEYRLWEG